MIWYSVNVKPEAILPEKHPDKNDFHGKRIILVVNKKSLKAAIVLYDKRDGTVTAHDEGIDHWHISEFDVWTTVPLSEDVAQ